MTTMASGFQIFHQKIFSLKLYLFRTPKRNLVIEKMMITLLLKLTPRTGKIPLTTLFLTKNCYLGLKTASACARTESKELLGMFEIFVKTRRYTLAFFGNFRSEIQT